MNAAIAGDLGKVKELLDRGSQISERDSADCSPLVRACEHGHLEVAKLLLERGATVNSSGSFLYSALGQASRNGHLNVVKWLLENGADVHQQTGLESVTPLWHAIIRGHVDVAEELSSYGAEIAICDCFMLPLLVSAARSNQVESVAWLALKGADFNARSETFGTTAFLEACAHGNVKMVKYLHSFGLLDLADTNQKGYTSMNLAVSSGNLRLVKLLFKYGWKYSEGQRSPLMDVKDVETLDFLLDKGLSPNFQESYGSSDSTPLSQAVINGRIDIAKRLVERGADPQLRHWNGPTAYGIAVSGTRFDNPQAYDMAVSGQSRPYASAADLALSVQYANVMKSLQYLSEFNPL